MGKKITFIGAGSLGFTRGLVNDLLTFPAFSDCTLSLMDINQERLDFANKAVSKLVASSGLPVTVEATTDRAKALDGADGVVCTILSGEIAIWRNDIEIPKKYGVDTNVGDTRGPSGIFRFLRTAPVMLDICKDIQKYCPNAIFLNYTNPMAMLCRIMQGEHPDLTITGLCHSVQGTAHMLADWIGAPMDEVTYTCAGINHTAFYLDFKWNGKDAYPLLRKAIENPEIYNKELVRNEMFKALDYYVTESSGHNSEYNPWFRKRPDLIEKYCTHGTNWNPGAYAYILNEYLHREDTWKEETKKYLEGDIKVHERGNEYAAYIFNACFGDHELFTFNGNVRNFGIIENLPYGACVEVPCLASHKGIEAMQVGAMPDHLALMCNISSRIEELAVRASLEGDPKLVYQAICFDPLTSAVLSLEEIKNMVNDMFAASADYLPQFSVKHVD
nr:alpha-galactosidase [bacterium]